MKDSLHRLAQRAGLGTLRQQLTALFAALLTLSLGVYTVYVGDEQVEFIERLERQHADELTHALAAALEPDLASGNTASATRHLLKLDDNPHIRRATVTDRQGVPLASVARRGERAQIAVEPPGDTPIPLPDSARRAAQGATGNGSTHFIAWAGIGGDAPLGWLRIAVAPVGLAIFGHGGRQEADHARQGLQRFMHLVQGILVVADGMEQILQRLR